MKYSAIPLFKEINELHVLTGSKIRTSNPLFHCFDMSLTNDLQLNETKPHRADFCTLALNIGTENLEYSLNDISFNDPSNFVLCVAPGQIASWSKGGNWYGYCTFFKPEFLNFNSSFSFLDHFPYFNIKEANLIKISYQQSSTLRECFVKILEEQNANENFREEIVRSLFQTLLWYVRRIYESRTTIHVSHKRNLVIAAQFQYLVNEFFLQHITVEEYAAQLNVSANHLSQTVIEATGIPAKKFISARRLKEAKYLLQFSSQNISEISDHLGFSEPTHFVKFFKKEEGVTPTRYRKEKKGFTI